MADFYHIWSGSGHFAEKRSRPVTAPDIFDVLVFDELSALGQAIS